MNYELVPLPTLEKFEVQYVYVVRMG